MILNISQNRRIEGAGNSHEGRKFGRTSTLKAGNSGVHKRTHTHTHTHTHTLTHTQTQYS